MRCVTEQAPNNSKLRGICNSSTLLEINAVRTSQIHREQDLDKLDGCIINDDDPVTYASLVRSCGNAKALSYGKSVHERAIKFEYEKDLHLGSLLVRMYANCDALQDAEVWFYHMRERNVFSWNFMIGAYVRHGHGTKALQLFQGMRQEAVLPDQVTFVTILSAFASQAALRNAQLLHIHTAHVSGIIIETALVSTYGKCGRPEDARQIFDKMPDRNVISWNSIITAYAQNGHVKESLQIFKQMLHEGVIPNKTTFITIINACTTKAALIEGKILHMRSRHSEFEPDIVIKTALIDMYGNCGNLKLAQMMFDDMSERNIISWNVMITTYVQYGHAQEAEQFFEQILRDGLIPNKVTFVSILSVWESKKDLYKGRRLHIFIIICGLEMDVVLANALVSMYGKCGSLEDAQKVFDSMSERNVVSWTAIIEVCTRHGHNKEALQLFYQMRWKVMPNEVTYTSVLSACACAAAIAEGKQVHYCIVHHGFDFDIVVGTALVNMYGKCVSLEDAERIFDNLHGRDVVAWNAMIAAYAQHEDAKRVLHLLNQMHWEGVVPTKSTYVSILSACSAHAALVEGKLMHTLITESGFELDLVVGTSIINMYNRCGGLQDARKVFNKMPEQNAVSWNAMIAAYAQHGHGKEALCLFQQMQEEGVPLNETTISSVLSACNHTGLINEGSGYFLWMASEHGATPLREHYECLVDLLGRVGRLDEAEDLINKMPIQPTLMSWMSLLSACRSMPDVKRGERAAKYMLELDPTDSSPYITLSNMYVTFERG